MRGATHLAWGALVGLAIGAHHDLPTLALCAGTGALASLAPDWLQINIPGASQQIKGVFGHRGFSHWIWTAFAAGYGLYLVDVPPPVVCAAVAGWCSHIVLDALANGVPALWPLKRITLAHIKTGSSIDTLIGSFALIITVVICMR
jgi:membrane-bound metal-dependent hydrolase YbcI (DUF457 family)